MTDYDNEDELVIDVPDAVALPDGTYRFEVMSMKHVTLTKDDVETKSHVITLQIPEGPYKGAQQQVWIRRDDPRFNVNQMQVKTLNSFLDALADGNDFERTVKYVRNEEGNFVNTAVEGYEVGAVIQTKNGYTNVKSFIPVSELEDSDDAFD